MRSYYGLSLTQLRTRRLRLLLTAAGIVLGVGMSCGVLLLAGTIQRTFTDLYNSVYGEADLVLSGAQSTGTLAPSALERARATEAHAFFGQDVTGFVQPMARVAADLAAVDLLKYFSRVLPGGVAGRLIEADLMAPSLRTRTVLKAPRCPVCSPARSEPASPPSDPSGET